jgi:hypothetical protein
LNQAAVIAEASNIRQANPELEGEPLFLAAVESLIDRFVDGLESPASEVVRNTVVEDSNVFELIFNFFDADHSMGTQSTHGQGLLYTRGELSRLT